MASVRKRPRRVRAKSKPVFFTVKDWIHLAIALALSALATFWP